MSGRFTVEQERSMAMLNYRMAVVHRHWVAEYGQLPTPSEASTIVGVLAALESDELRRTPQAVIQLPPAREGL